MGNRGIAKAKDKIQRWRISLKGKQENFIASVKKWQMLAAYKVKMSCQYKKNEQEYMWHFLNKTCKN